ncbi:hypothetical protein AB0J47_14695 [Nocardia sp. NPDC049737]|uniref:hypothetical protein n=1 Tax=Nocardia sp. NPDC049737 TaxID=3154358 RepID=UPI00342D94B5
MWLGNISFAFYLIQFPVMVLITRLFIGGRQFGWLGFARLSLIVERRRPRSTAGSMNRSCAASPVAAPRARPRRREIRSTALSPRLRRDEAESQE